MSILPAKNTNTYLKFCKFAKKYLPLKFIIMGIIFVIIGGIVGYQVGSRMTTNNWGMKILHAFWPGVALFLLTLMLCACAKDPWASYNVASFMTPALIGTISYALFILFMMKIVKDGDDKNEITNAQTSPAIEHSAQEENAVQTSPEDNNKETASSECKLYVLKSNNTKVRQCGIQDGKKVYEDAETKNPLGFIEDSQLMEFNGTDSETPATKESSNSWIIWIVALLIIGLSIKALVSYQEKKSEEQLREYLEKNPDFLRY